MPSLQYRALHWGTTLTAADVIALLPMGKTGDCEESLRR
jgi:hypothetical protein